MVCAQSILGCHLRVFWYPFDPHQVYQASHKCQSSTYTKVGFIAAIKSSTPDRVIHALYTVLDSNFLNFAFFGSLCKQFFFASIALSGSYS